MSSTLLHADVSPVEKSDGVRELHKALRLAILEGRLEAGSLINQVHLAKRLGISRTPLREALRMLQAEELVVAGRHQRMRVAPLDPRSIDSLYASRILLEALGLALTMPRLDRNEIDQLKTALRHMNTEAWIGTREAWEVPHNAFHCLLVKHTGTVAGPILQETVAGLQLRSERYRRLYGLSDPALRTRAMQDHTAIVQAVAAGDTHQAILELAAHLEHTALGVLALVAPGYEPASVRQAMAAVRSGQVLVPGQRADAIKLN